MQKQNENVVFNAGLSAATCSQGIIGPLMDCVISPLVDGGVTELTVAKAPWRL